MLALNRLFGFQRHPHIDIDTADWPPVTVLVAAHNEEKVIANILDALMTRHTLYYATRWQRMKVNLDQPFALKDYPMSASSSPYAQVC
jgi:hypothetical protein